MEAALAFFGIVGLLAIGFFAYLFLGLFLKACLLWIPVVIGFVFPVACGFAFGTIVGGLGILVGIGTGYYVYDRWEDHSAYLDLTKKIDSIFQTE